MRRICYFLFLIAFLIISSQTIFAYNCTFEYNPFSPKIEMDDLEVSITSDDLATGKYTGAIVPPNNRFHDLSDYFDYTFGDSAKFVFKKNMYDWTPGTYLVYVFKEGSATINPKEMLAKSSCSTSFTIAPTPSQPCSMAVENAPLDPSKKPTIDVNNITPNDCGPKKISGGYDIFLDGKLYPPGDNVFCTQDNKTPTGNQLILPFLDPGNYTLELKDRCSFGFLGNCKRQSICSAVSFRVCSGGDPSCSKPSTGGLCTIAIISPRNPDPLHNLQPYDLARGDFASVQITNLIPNEESHTDLLKGGTKIKEAVKKNADGAGQMAFQLFTNAELGEYAINAYDKDDNLVCKKDFKVTEKGSEIQVKRCKPDDKTCTLGGGDSCNDAIRGPGIQTAIGCIHTNPTEFVKDIMTWIIGIGGGLAFLMMILGAFQMLTSAGNPETLAAGRSRLTSAVIGILFIIFSVLLMQIIGFDILKIPGFGR